MNSPQLMTEKNKIVWWKDKKFLLGITLIILSVFMGEFGKWLSIIKFYIPRYLLAGLSLWAFSWVLLFAGIFLIGLETFRMIKQRIHHHVKKTVRGTYHYTKQLHKKGIARIKKSITKND